MTKKYKLVDENDKLYDINEFVDGSNLMYHLEFNNECVNDSLRKTMWKNWSLIPLTEISNIISSNEGDTSISRIPELEPYLNNCKFYIKNEGSNPTGTFKDREGSYIISKVREMGLSKIVFHSTGNTGRSYMYYAKKAGIESFFFLPLSCMDKCDLKILSKKNHIIAVDGKFNAVSKIAKMFAKKNNIVTLAPLHDKLEGKATIAYEQFKELPETTIFAQTIAGGYGVLGYLLGYERLLNNGMIKKETKIPKIYAIQHSDGDTISRAINNGLDSITDKDLSLSDTPFEKTLQSTNPLKTYEAVRKCIEKSDGKVQSVNSLQTFDIKSIFENALKNHDISVSYDNEKSPYIGFAGLVELAKKNEIKDKDVIYFVLTGVGRKNDVTPRPEAILKPTSDGYDILECSDYLKDFL